MSVNGADDGLLTAVDRERGLSPAVAMQISMLPPDLRLVVRPNIIVL